MAEAFRQLASGRIRPVAVEAPWDVFGMKAEVAQVAPLGPIAPPTPDPDSIAAAARPDRRRETSAPQLGAGALHAGESILELAELLQAPVAAHRSGKGIVSDDSPYGMNLVAAYDYWKAQTCSSASVVAWSSSICAGAGSRAILKLVRIDIDPTEMVRLKPHVGIVTDSALGTRALINCPAAARRPSAVRASRNLPASRRGRARLFGWFSRRWT